MSFSKVLLKNNTIYCIRNSYRNQQDLKWISNNYLSSNTKRCYSLCTSKTSSFVGLRLKTNSSYRTLSSFKSDTTITFNPSLDEKKSVPENDANALDLSNFVVPEVPNPLDPSISDVLINNIDIPITALGLGSNWTPVGWALHGLEYLHGLFPWWATIAVTTLALRICMFPVVIKAQKNAMKMNKILPQIQLLQEKSTQARLSGNSLEFAKYSAQMQDLYKTNDINPFKSLMVPMIQAPIFITFFVTLRRMANLPVESMKTGGILWFTDLTISDPYFILPVVTSVSLWAALELGVESGLQGNQSVVIKTFIRAMPVVTFLFITQFPTALLTYWCTSNIISLLQVFILKQKPVREYLNIPAPIKYKPGELPTKQKGFVQSVKESMDNAKITRKLEDRKRLDEINFKKAAIGPIKKTYKYDPTKLENKN